MKEETIAARNPRNYTLGNSLKPHTVNLIIRNFK